MTTLIGLAPGERGTAALHLGAMMARSAEDPLVVATVLPTPWPPSPYPGEAEYLAYAERAAEQALARARTQLGTDLADDYVVHRARSVSSGLLEVALEHAAGLVVLGSATSGVLGRVSLGGVADRVLHSSDVSVVLAPKGFRVGSGTRVSRITVGYGRADADSDLLVSAAARAESLGASLRVACFAVRPMTAFAGTIEEGADELVVDQWTKHLHEGIQRSLQAVDAGSVSTRIDTVVGRGSSWGEAVSDVSWTDGDVLAIGSSSSAVSRFFLGSHASKIVRSSPVPVLLTPRGTTTP